MSMSPITSWDGAAAVYTFGPASLGIWVFLAITLVIAVGVIAHMIYHEYETFSGVSPDLVKGGALKGANI